MTITAEEVIFGLGLLVSDHDEESDGYSVNVKEARSLLAHINTLAAEIDNLKTQLSIATERAGFNFDRAESAEKELAALREQKPVSWQFMSANGHWLSVSESGKDAAVKEGCKVRPLFSQPVPPAPVAVPDERATLRSEWTVEDWVLHVGGRYQNNDPANYVEFGSMTAVAALIKQVAHSAKIVGFNACRAEVLRLNSGSKPAVKPVKLPEALLPANHRSGEAFMAADSEGNYLNREFTIKAIRAAGGEIEE
ncbi:hypothetical protein PMPD1_2517 [Paramixta manurensis]|uniref:Uncharacterized protein n=1 Tax=Paramixta manurensis TaxID=2740817 RepID=A0A6M8UCJ8_9GAMM|nr:hypothetical protein PMPD1_2517 [Erwiniaceae bacterium PD-1]